MDLENLLSTANAANTYKHQRSSKYFEGPAATTAQKIAQRQQAIPSAEVWEEEVSSICGGGGFKSKGQGEQEVCRKEGGSESGEREEISDSGLQFAEVKPCFEGWTASKAGYDDSIRSEQCECGTAESVRPLPKKVQGLVQGERLEVATSISGRRNPGRLLRRLVSRGSIKSRGGEDHRSYGIFRPPVERQVGEKSTCTSGLAKAHSSQEQATIAEANRLWDSHEVVGNAEDRDGSDGSSQLRLLSETWGGNGSSGEEFDPTYQEHRGTVQTLHPGGSRPRRRKARQNRNLQQLTAFGQSSNSKLVGEGVGEVEDPSGEEQSLVQIHHGQVPSGIPVSRQLVGLARSSHLPIETWRRIRRSIQWASRSQCGQRSRTMENRQLSEEIWQSGETARSIESVAAVGPRVLQKISGADGTGCGRSSCPMQPLSPLWQPWRAVQGQCILEVFAGSGRLCSQLRREGFRAFPIDTCLHSEDDVLSCSTENSIVELLLSGKVMLLWSTVPEGYERAIDHFEFDLTGSGLSYEQGDSLGLWPSNPKKQVDMCLMALNMKGDEVLHLRPIDSNRSVPLPEVISVRTLLTEVLDIAGWPKRRFYEMLKLSATDAQEQDGDRGYFFQRWKSPRKRELQGRNISLSKTNCFWSNLILLTMTLLQSAASAILEVVVNPMGVLDMGVNVMSVRDSWKQHHHSLEAGERLHLESMKVSQSQHSEALQHGLNQHQESIYVSKDQHDQSLQVNRVMHDEALSHSKLQHDEQMKHSYMETRRENLRDLLSETLDEAQSTVLKSTLLFGFVVAVLVEGFPSPENSNERYIDVFIFSVSWAICLLFQSIVLAGLYQVVQTRALREMIRNLQVQAPMLLGFNPGELQRCNTMDSSSSSLSDGWADLEREPPVQHPRGSRPYSSLHPSSQKLKRHKIEGSDSFASNSTKEGDFQAVRSSHLLRGPPYESNSSPDVQRGLHVFDPKRLMYRSQAKKFVTMGSLFTLICLAGLIYGRLSMRRGSKYGEGAPDVLLRLGIFLPPFISAMFSLLLRKNSNPIRSTLAVQSLAWLCFFVSLAFLLTTSLIWHAAAPSIKVTPDSEVVFLKGSSLELDDWPMFFHPTGVAATGNILLLSAAFRIARFEWDGFKARLVNEVTLPALEIGDLTFSPATGLAAVVYLLG
eukprot:symbB.v1.2.022027.t1/scaffold1936.1/size153520/1